MDFGGVRYYDEREMPNLWKEYIPLPEKERLPSDSCFRDDLLLLSIGDIPTAQSAKEKIEGVQRNDANLRVAAHKRRAEGGPKIMYKY